MTSEYLAAAGMLSYVATFLLVRWLIRSLRGSTVVGIDIHKRHRPRIPEMGGLAILAGFAVGVLVLALEPAGSLQGGLYEASLLAILGAAFVGILDDLFSIRQTVKAVLPFLSALPLGILVYLQGDTDLLGLDTGVLMVLLVPAGITSAANAANMLEGFNGLGAGLGVIMSGGLIVLAMLLGALEGLFLLVPMFGALLAFLWYNRYPARVFPGDSMTLSSGAAIACAAIISSPSFKLYGFFLFIPMIAEFVLKARGRFRAENYGVIRPDGRLVFEGRAESLTHLIMQMGSFKEWQVVAILWAVEAVLCGIVILAVVLGL